MSQDNAWKVLLATYDWVRFADTKASLALAGAGIAGGFLVRVSLEFDGRVDNSWATLLTILSGIALATSAAFSLVAVTPRLAVGEPTSIVYFGHIAAAHKGDCGSFVERFRSSVNDADSFDADVASQIWANAVVARKKFRNAAWSLIALALGIALGVGAGLIALATA